MKKGIVFFTLITFVLAVAAGNKKTESPENKIKTNKMLVKSGYADVNGLKMYYKIYGNGKPLVLIHGGGSTIQTTFGRVIPLLARQRQLVAVEMQAHGRTSDRENELSFEQDADDVAALLKELHISKADIFGFSNGGTTAIQLVIRHPGLVDKVIAASALCKRNGVPAQFWGYMEQARIENMPEQLKEAYKQVAADTAGLQVMHDKDVKRMINFEDISDEKLKAIQTPVLIVIGDQDVITPEHALELHRLIPHSRLAILPGGHGEYLGEITTLKPDTKESDFMIPLIERFLDEKFD